MGTKMTPAQLGTYAQDEFERIIRNIYGKEAYIYRFPDTKDVRHKAIGESSAWIKKQPADYHVTARGKSMFAEVKATENADRFSLGRLEPSQRAAIEQIRHAGGFYTVFLLHKQGRQEQWYCLPLMFIHECLMGNKTLQFKHLGEFKWNTNTVL